MALKLEDLSINSRAVMRALAERPAIRRTLADKTGLSPMQVSKVLNRLSAFELVDHPEGMSTWALNAAGYALLGAPAPEADVPMNVHQEPAQAADEPAVETAELSTEMSTDDVDDADFDPTAWVPEPPVTPPLPAKTDQIAADLLAAMEIEIALDYVRSKLRSPAIPARAQRVYQEVLNVLPPTLVEALAPITTLVAVYNLQ